MKRIFVIDDEIPILEWLTMCVRTFDPSIEVSAFCNGEEAMAAMEHETPSLIITDVAMPKMNGIELLEAVRQKGYTADVVIMSGHQDFEYARASLKFGAADYILKSELTQESIFALLEKMQDQAAHKSRPAPSRADAIQNQVLKSAYLKRILAEGRACKPEELRENDIFLKDAPFFIVVLSNDEASIRALDDSMLANMEEREWISLDLSLVFAANVSGQHRETPQRFVQNLRQSLGERVNLGYSAVYESIAQLGEAVQQAREMRDREFFNAQHSALVLRSEKERKRVSLDLFNLHREIANQYKVFGSDTIHSSAQKFMLFVRELQYYDVDYIKLATCAMLESLYHHAETNGMDIDEAKTKVYGATDIEALEAAVLEFCKSLPQKHHYSESIEKAIAYLHAHYDEPISLSDVAGHIHLSDEYLSRLFRKEVGKTFTDYLNAFRMQEAMRLLKSTNRKVADICEAVGIPNPKYFSLLFKKYFSMSPSQARE